MYDKLKKLNTKLFHAKATFNMQKGFYKSNQKSSWVRQIKTFAHISRDSDSLRIVKIPVATGHRIDRIVVFFSPQTSINIQKFNEEMMSYSSC